LKKAAETDSIYQALKILNEAEAIFSKLNDSLSLALIGTERGIAKLYNYEIEAAKALLLKNYYSVERDGGIEYRHRSNYCLAQAFFELGEIRKAANYAGKSLQLAKQCTDSSYIINALNLHALILARQSKYYEAIQLYNECLTICKQTNNERSASYVENNLSLIFLDLNDYLNAAKYMRKSLAYDLKVNDDYNLCISYENFARIHIGTNTIDSAILYNQLAYKIKTRKKFEDLLIDNYLNRSYIAEKIGRYSDAAKYALEAMNQSIKTNVKSSESEILYQLCFVYFQLNKNDSAQYFGKLALEKAQNRSEMLWVMKTANILYKYFNNKKQKNEADQYLKIKSAAQDSLFNFERLSSTSALLQEASLREANLLNEIITKQKEIHQLELRKRNTTVSILILAIFFSVIFIISLIRSNNDKLKLNETLQNKSNQLELLNQSLKESRMEALSKNAQLEELNRMKTKLFGIISHDFKNPLHNISSLLQLLEDEQINNENSVKIMADLNQKIKSTENFLENLLLWSMKQIDGEHIEYQDIEMKEISENLLMMYKSNLNEKQLQVITKWGIESGFKSSRAVIDMVMRNLFSNAMKYSKKGGVIEMGNEIAAHEILFWVADHGIGIEQHKLKSLFSLSSYQTEGTSGEKGNGVGLMFSKEFLEKIKGKIFIETYVGEGTKVYFAIPYVV
jgi:signal transduction histidine kinase